MYKQEFFDKFVEAVTKFGQIATVQALRDGMILTMPFTVGGSIFLLIANLPIPGYAEFMTGIFGTNWTDSLNAVANATFGALAFVIVIGITYRSVSLEGSDAPMATIIALLTFLALLPPEIKTASGNIVSGVIPRTWIGANGIITAIFVAFFVSQVFLYCDRHNLGIKMPESIPIEIVRSIWAFTPAVICFVTAAIVYGICHHILNSTFPELIFQLIQSPLQGLSDTLLGGFHEKRRLRLYFWLFNCKLSCCKI